MSWVVVKGIYKKGVVEPLESVPYREGVEVLVLFPERIKWTGVKGIWQQIKQEIAKQMPDLLSMTDDERKGEFDRLSNVIARAYALPLAGRVRAGNARRRVWSCWILTSL